LRGVLRPGRGGDGAARTTEDNEKGVALRIYLDASMVGERRPHKPAMHSQRIAVVLLQPLHQLRRLRDVRKEKRDCPARECDHELLSSHDGAG